MRTISSAPIMLFILALLPQTLHAQTSSEVVAIEPGQVEWQENEEGFDMAVLYGDPSTEGHYVIRFKLPPDWAGRPHTHGGAEIVSVHSGTMYFAYGEDLSREAAKPMGPGSFIVLPAGTKMRPFTGGEETIVEVQGQGPFTTEYLDE